MTHEPHVDVPREPLRIAMTSYYLPSESKIGAGWMAHRLANALAERGHSVCMFSPCERPDDARYECRLIDLRGRLRVFKWAHRMRHVDLAGFDVFHSHGDDFLVSRRIGAAHVRTLHGSCLDEALHIQGAAARGRMLALGLTELVSATRFRNVVGVSLNSIRWYPWLHEVIPNGVDTSQFRPGGNREDEPTILFVGTFHRRKRGALLQQVFVEYIRPRMPNARLWMVCEDAPPAPGVEVLGRVSDDELAELYRGAWVFCLPSSYEGFGVPYIEAMASGTAVVATPNRGAREVLDDGRIGALCSDRDLGSTLVDVLGDAHRRDRYASLGLREARSRYDWSIVAAAYEDLYHRAIGDRDVAS